jgi:hypothetical protein
VALPPVGPGAAWLSNGTVYRSLGPSTDPTKLCQATDGVLSFSPNGELLAVLTWDSYNGNRTLQVFDEGGVPRKGPPTDKYYSHDAEWVQWLNDANLHTYGSQGRVPVEVDQTNLIQKERQVNPWGTGSVISSSGSSTAVRYEDRTEIVPSDGSAGSHSLGVIDPAVNASVATCSQSAVAWIGSDGHGYLLSAAVPEDLGSDIVGVALDGDVVAATWMKSGEVRFHQSPTKQVNLPFQDNPYNRPQFSKRFFWQNDRLVVGSDDGKIRVFERNGKNLWSTRESIGFYHRSAWASDQTLPSQQGWMVRLEFGNLEKINRQR